MAEKKNNATRRNTRRNIHKHDVHIVFDDKTKKTIEANEWQRLLESNEAKLFPKKLNDYVATTISAYWLATIIELETRRYTYDSSNEEAFGFTTIPIYIIDKVKEIYDAIDNTIFFVSTFGDNEKFDTSKIVKSLIGDGFNCLVSVVDLKSLNWLVTRLKFFCTDVIHSQGYKGVPEFYKAEMLDIDNIKSWFVPAEYVKAFFDFETDSKTITIEDNGVKIRFSKEAPLAEEICFDSDDYCITSVHDAIKNIMTDYFYNHLSKN